MGRILLIEDDPGTQLLLQSRLKDLGHEVVTAPTGAMGVMEARSGSFDLFLVDVMLGSGIDGYEVCRRLKGMPHTHGVPIVLVSGIVKNREELHKGYEAGCEQFLIKGDMTLLEDVVRAMLRLKSLQDELAIQNRLLDDHNRRLQEEKARAADLESAIVGSGGDVSRAVAGVSARCTALLVVDADGVVTLVDRGARELFGKELEGKHLGRLAVGSGLEAFVRDARTESRHGFRFDLPASNGREGRRLSASIDPLMVRAGHKDRGYKVVLLNDVGAAAAEREAGLQAHEVGPLLEAARAAFHPSGLIGISPEISQIRQSALELAKKPEPAFVCGGSGSGKQRLARALHFGAPRKGPFVWLNCGGISPELLEVELFGSSKSESPDGEERQGLLHLAQRGTLYLSEIHALPHDLQDRLAQVIENGTFSRVGSKRVEKNRSRMVFASPAGLEQLEAEQRITPALARPLGLHAIEVPDLSRRLEDVPVLAQHFLAQHGAALGTPEFSDEALWVLENYDWPGNVRELENAIERACANATGPVIDVEQLPRALRDLQGKLLGDNQIPPARRREERTAGTHLPSRFGQSQPGFGAPAAPPEEEEVSLEIYEKKALLRALEMTGNDKLAAARLLKIGKSTLYRKLKRYDIK